MGIGLHDTRLQKKVERRGRREKHNQRTKKWISCGRHKKQTGIVFTRAEYSETFTHLFSVLRRSKRSRKRGFLPEKESETKIRHDRSFK